MTIEQLERAIQFCLDQQAAFWASNAELQESFKKLKEELETVKEITQGLVTVAQMHSRRLDRLDGIGPS